ncbi:imidazole glycerol phosphate synthase chloroplastic [Chlorella sorokiniana]|uniref:Imidazole glycerol phosphate synthase hisHF n=1 Tax=Chlorella sorokiniana TaxID=3076 RepID=A0A2P6TWP3_CHLSO|nr:imidazole glycerol phosphate synthase chloroplastic [Chlorella sorokiniana]|eukprot:PRW58480.1 imidazole glycerol phosphate synthase chloroplastic [Chlorella sorokiniana]
MSGSLAQRQQLAGLGAQQAHASRQLRTQAAAGRPGRCRLACAAAGGDREVTLLDYGAGNVRSVRNAIRKLGYSIKEVESAADIAAADKLVFPGVGAFGQAMHILQQRGYVEALRDYIHADRPFMGICLGMQLLFEGSEESGGCEGLALVPGRVTHFDTTKGLPVPHIGWNDLIIKHPSALLSQVADRRVYFVHSYHATPSPENAEWVLATSDYGGEFVAAVQRGNVCATQFHPEKSGAAGLDILRSFLDPQFAAAGAAQAAPSSRPRGLAKRVIACLDVRANDNGDLVVTKGDQYDVRESGSTNEVRNLGKPVELAGRYFDEGADEVTFLNITGFRDFPLGDLPMLEVLRQASEGVFVPLTVGGGIREFTDGSGKHYSALQVAAEYFRSGADKVSIGSDAVLAVEQYLASGKQKDGSTAIEQISRVYGAQAVVVSIDPKRVWVADPANTTHHCVKSSKTGPNGEQWCWWQCTVKGGREGRDVDAVQLAQAVEDLGAGEILLNCIDCDGVGQGFDIELVAAVSDAVTIPVIASSGAGAPEHFSEVFQKTRAAAALAAGIFHRREVPIAAVKDHLNESGIPARTA